MKYRIAVLGAGSWGTALGILLANNGHQVLMWARDPERCAEISRAGKIINICRASLSLLKWLS